MQSDFVILEMHNKLFSAMVTSFDKLPYRITVETLESHFEEIERTGNGKFFKYYRPKAGALFPWVPDISRDDMLTSLHGMLKETTSDLIKLREHQERIRKRIQEIQADVNWSPAKDYGLELRDSGPPLQGS